MEIVLGAIEPEVTTPNCQLESEMDLFVKEIHPIQFTWAKLDRRTDSNDCGIPLPQSSAHRTVEEKTGDGLQERPFQQDGREEEAA